MSNQSTRESRTPRQPLLARRRTPEGDGSPEAIVYSKELHLDFDRRVIAVRGKPVHLAPKEFELLRYLVANRGRPVSHQRVLQAVWGPGFGDQRERLRVVINELRKKIEADPARPNMSLRNSVSVIGLYFPRGRAFIDPSRRPMKRLSTSAVAKLVGVHPLTLERWLSSGGLPWPKTLIANGRVVRLWEEANMSNASDAIKKRGGSEPRPKFGM